LSLGAKTFFCDERDFSNWCLKNWF
jgi:hypothetical protein